MRSVSLDLHSLILPRSAISYRRAGHGPPTLLIHGWGASSRYWFGVIAALHGQRDLIAPDLPGFGASPPPQSPAEPAELAQHLFAFADALGLDRFALVGHSLGAAVATLMAAQQPQRIERMALVSFGLPRSPLEQGLFGKLNMQLRWAALLWRPWLELWRPWYGFARPALAVQWATPPLPQWLARQYLYRPPAPELLQAGVADLLAMDPRVALESSSSIGDPRLATAAGTVSTPSLVIVGRHDEIFPTESALALTRALQQARLVVFDDCGHVPMVEQPQLLHHALNEFLR